MNDNILQHFDQPARRIIDDPGEQLPTIQLNPTQQKAVIYALNVIRASADITDQAEISRAAKTLCWGVRCLGLLKTSPWETVSKLGMPVNDLPSVSQFIMTIKKSSDYITVPPRLLYAAVSYGLVHPSVKTFVTPAIVEELTNLSKNVKITCGLVAIIESGKQLMAPEINPPALTQSLSLVGVAAAAALGWTNTRLGLEILSHLMGLVVIWQQTQGEASKKPRVSEPEKDISPSEAGRDLSPEKPIENTTASFYQLREKAGDVISAQFKEIEAHINEYPDDTIRCLLRGDFLEQKALFEHYLENADNQDSLSEVLRAYQNVFLESVIAQGLVNGVLLDEIEILQQANVELPEESASDQASEIRRPGDFGIRDRS